MPEKIRVGNVEIAAARDADFRFAPAAFLPTAPRDGWKPFLGDVSPDEVQESRVFTFAVWSQGKVILVDTGVGEWGLWRFGDGHLLDSLKDLDLAPEDIDFVLPTHLHGDHVGWNTRPDRDGNPVPTFPRARYLFQQADWDYFTSQSYFDNAPPGSTVPEMMRKAVLPMKDTGLMELIGPERIITDEVTLLHTPGHTPGSVTVLVQSAGEAALLIGDAAHHPAELTNTDWAPLADIDPVLSSRSRRAIVEGAKQMNGIIASAHSPASDPAFGRMVEIEGRNIYRAGV